MCSHIHGPRGFAVCRWRVLSYRVCPVSGLFLNRNKGSRHSRQCQPVSDCALVVERNLIRCTIPVIQEEESWLIIKPLRSRPRSRRVVNRASIVDPWNTAPAEGMDHGKFGNQISKNAPFERAPKSGRFLT
jgi:hypothetical protein